MGRTESFRYATSPETAPSIRLNRLKEASQAADPQPLTGLVHGKTASDLEERFARGLVHAGMSFTFQKRIFGLGSIPGQERVIDFVVERGFLYPIEVDGPYAHNTAAQKGADLVREIMLNHNFARVGIQPIRRVKWWQLETQEMTNRLVREMFGGKQ